MKCIQSLVHIRTCAGELLLIAVVPRSPSLVELILVLVRTLRDSPHDKDADYSKASVIVHSMTRLVYADVIKNKNPQVLKVRTDRSRCSGVRWLGAKHRLIVGSPINCWRAVNILMATQVPSRNCRYAFSSASIRLSKSRHTFTLAYAD